MARSCLGEIDGLTFWLAWPDDYGDVMSISDNLFKGNDYLPHRYHDWMTEPGRMVVLARREGKLVGLGSGLVVDEGSTVVMEGLRVCPSERGRGVATIIQRFADDYIRQLHPTVQMKRMIRGPDPGPEKLAKFTLLARRVAMARSCLGETDGLTFWLARPDDYGDVMSISDDIYGGNDYLPHRYHDWMKEPGRTVILACKEGKLVALESHLVVDEGTTVVVEGLRVCPSERGRGIAGIIQRFADGYIRQLYPTIQMKRMTRADDPGPEKLAKFTLLARRAALSLFGEAENFDGFISHLRKKLHSTGTGSDSGASVAKMVPLEKEQLKRILLDPKLPSRVQLPGGAIIQDWKPLRPMKGNLEILGRRDWLADSQEAPVFLSFYTPPYPVAYKGGSIRLNIDMFGTDPVLARWALVGHFERSRTKGELQGTVIVHVYMDVSLWETLRGFFEGYAGVTRCSDYWEQLFLERGMYRE